MISKLEEREIALLKKVHGSFTNLLRVLEQCKNEEIEVAFGYSEDEGLHITEIKKPHVITGEELRTAIKEFL